MECTGIGVLRRKSYKGALSLKRGRARGMCTIEAWVAHKTVDYALE